MKAQTSGLQEIVCTFFYLHLPKNVSTMRRSEELPIDSIDSTFSIESHMAEVGAASLRAQGMLPGTQIFTRPWDTCTLRGQAIAGTKRVIDEQHPEVLQRVQPSIHARISQFRCLLHKGESCRLCVMTPRAETSGNCLPLMPVLQAHVLQESQQQELSWLPREHDPRRAQADTAAYNASSLASRTVGTGITVFTPKGFLLLASTSKPLLR